MQPIQSFQNRILRFWIEKFCAAFFKKRQKRHKKRAPLTVASEWGAKTFQFCLVQDPRGAGLMQQVEQGIRGRTLCSRHAPGVLSRALAGALVSQAARRLKIRFCTITCTARPDGSGARNEPRQPSGSPRTASWRGRGRHESDGCNGSR